ncbi:hypothetical protein CCP3SC1_780014 [Gammaproteobacteria bacterium]
MVQVVALSKIAFPGGTEQLSPSTLHRQNGKLNPALLETHMPEPRLIKKYPNRRLYDTGHSKYIALDDIRLLLLDGVNVRVVDAKSGEDITRSILLQIIVEQEDKGQPILGVELLERLIRFYGDTLQVFVSSYLEKSLDAFMHQQSEFHKQMEIFIEKTPLAVFGDIMEQNLALWKKMQSGVGQIYPFVKTTPSDRDDPESSDPKDP